MHGKATDGVDRLRGARAGLDRQILIWALALRRHLSSMLTLNIPANPAARLFSDLPSIFLLGAWRAGALPALAVVI